MWVLNLIILLIFIITAPIGLKASGDWMKTLDKKEHKLYFLYPFANWILVKSGLKKLLLKNSKTTEAIKAVYLSAKPDFTSKLFWCKRISLVISVIFLFNLLSLFGFLTSQNSSTLIDGKYLARPDHGEGKKEVELEVSLEKAGGENTSEKRKSSALQKVTIDVNEQSYTTEELDNLFIKSFEYLKNNVLGGNKSAELICDNLNFCDEIPGTGIKIDWIPKDYNLIHSDGTIDNKDISPEGAWTSITVILTYGDKQTEQDMSFHILPKQYTEDEILLERLNEEIDAASAKSATKELFQLPDSLQNYTLIWGEEKENNGLNLFFLGILLAAAVWILGDKELENQMKKRKEQMLIDYPEIINKFTLLINAGMTIKQAWIKMAEDYSSLSASKRGLKRYAYEEMLTTVRELKLGMPENTSYEQYGRRCGLIPYIKFSSLITQNLKKGTKGFTELLMHEAAEAFENRKEIAKRLGEEAGTKLLAPMMIMLVLVFLIIMIPAFLSFRI